MTQMERIGADQSLAKPEKIRWMDQRRPRAKKHFEL